MTRNRCWGPAVALAISVCISGGVAATETVPLATLDISKMSAGWGQPVANRSIQDRPLSIGGRKFEAGVGTHASSVLWVNLKKGSKRFTAWVSDNPHFLSRWRSYRPFKPMPIKKIIYR